MEKPQKKELNETDIKHLPDKEFNTVVIKMPNTGWRRTDEHSENFTKIENTKKNQSELCNTVTEMKNTLEEINSRLNDV